MTSNTFPGAQYQNNEAGGVDHVLPWVLHLLATGSPPSQIDANEFQRMVGHVNGCDVCQAGLVALANISAFPGLDALMAHVAHGGDDGMGHDRDEELAAYAIIANAEGAPVARKRLPALAKHLEACPICQETVAETRAELATIAAMPITTTTPTPAEAVDEIIDASQLHWERGKDGARYLIASYDIFVERMSVHITSTLAFPQIATDYTGNTRYLDQAGPRGDKAGAQQEQSFTVDLRDEMAFPRPWVRVRVSWRALFSGRLSGQIKAQLVAASNDEGEVAGALPWRIERWRDNGWTQSISSGTTSERGIARFTFHDSGRFMLTISAGGSDWQIPFTVAPETGA